MGAYRETVIARLESDQELSLGDRLLIGQVADRFVRQYCQAFGEEPSLSLDLFNWTVYPDLRMMGFRNSVCDLWRRDDIELARWMVNHPGQDVVTEEISNFDIFLSHFIGGGVVAAQKNFYRRDGD